MEPSAQPGVLAQRGGSQAPTGPAGKHMGGGPQGACEGTPHAPTPREGGLSPRDTPHPGGGLPRGHPRGPPHPHAAGGDPTGTRRDLTRPPTHSPPHGAGHVPKGLPSPGWVCPRGPSPPPGSCPQGPPQARACPQGTPRSPVPRSRPLLGGTCRGGDRGLARSSRRRSPGRGRRRRSPWQQATLPVTMDTGGAGAGSNLAP